MVVTVLVHAGIVQVRVIGKPESSRPFTPNTIWYGNWNVPVSLKSCARPPLTPLAFTSSLFGLLTLAAAWSIRSNV